VTITVILCTYNRCEVLANALQSVAASTLPEGVEWEVLVVDNNSTDQTRDVVEKFRREYPGRFRYQFEPRQGKSHALNTGIQAAAGEILAFMDDDVTAEPTWLQNLTASLQNAEWEGAGGRILPQWTCSPPSWLPVGERYGLAPLVMFDLGSEASALTEPPFGTNMAFQKRMFEKYGGFRTDLGPRPNSEMRGEDTEFGRRLLAAGERLKYEPSAVVYHSVSHKRLQQRFFLAYWFDKGRADIRELGIPADTKWHFAGIPLHFFRRLGVGTLRWMVALEPSRRLACKLKVWWIAGEILESYRRSQSDGTDTHGS
jgi:glucosyl-dolichyl phosphate glucuronosyltransferase